MLNQSLQILKQMQYPTGLFAASRMNVKTGYNLAWIRDNVYTAIGLEAAKKYNLQIPTVFSDKDKKIMAVTGIILTGGICYIGV